jgi:Reverse transcriptase (RNA-dependent DNA polymerase)
MLKDVIISFLHKKGDRFDCNNYRTLSLITHMGKVLERMILNRLNIVAEENDWLPESQNGFRNGRGAVDSLICCRLLSKYCRENCLPCYIAFVDLTKAYDKVDRDILWMVLSRLGVPSKLINLIKGIHVGAQAKVKDSGVFSQSFELKRGLKQGSCFAPILFNIFFGAIVNAINSRIDRNNGIDIKYHIGNDIFNDIQLDEGKPRKYMTITDLLFADAAAFISSTEEGLQRKMNIVVEVVSAFGQLVSIKKTEVLLVQPRIKKDGVKLPDPVITIEGEVLRVVSKFKYVGSLQNTTADITDEVDIRIQRMAVAYKQKKTILFENRRIKLSVRLKAFCAFVVTAGIYGCETWNSTVKDIDRLESKQFWYLRRILNYKWEQLKSFADLIYESRLAGVNILPISALVSMSRLSYFGHVNRMSNKRYPKILINAHCLHGRKLCGGQEMNYNRVLLSDLKAFGIDDDFNKWSKLVQDRVGWRKAVKERGVQYYMQNWYSERTAASNARHLKKDKDYPIKFPYVFNVCAKSELVKLQKAINSGAVTTGRGSRERGSGVAAVTEKIQETLADAMDVGLSSYVRKLLIACD